MKLTDLMNQAKEMDRLVEEPVPPPGDLGEYITAAQAAKILGVNDSRVRQLVAEKRLKSYKPEKGRRDHFFKLSEVKAFAKQDRERTGRPPES